MNVYQVVREQLNALIEELARHQAHVGEPDYFYYIRDLDREPGFAQSPPNPARSRHLRPAAKIMRSF